MTHDLSFDEEQHDEPAVQAYCDGHSGCLWSSGWFHADSFRHETREARVDAAYDAARDAGQEHANSAAAADRDAVLAQVAMSGELSHLLAL